MNVYSSGPIPIVDSSVTIIMVVSLNLGLKYCRDEIYESHHEKKTLFDAQINLCIHTIFALCIIWASAQENLSPGFANNKGADKPAHPHSLNSAFVIRVLESIVSKLAKSEISLF